MLGRHLRVGEPLDLELGTVMESADSEWAGWKKAEMTDRWSWKGSYSAALYLGLLSMP